MVDAHMDELGGVIRRVTPAASDHADARRLARSGAGRSALDHRRIERAGAGRDRHSRCARGAAGGADGVYSRDVFLDVGAKDEAEVAAMGIGPGDPVVPDAPFTVMNGTENYLGKGWDDRVGCGVVIEAMGARDAPHPNQIFWVTTQEEIGLRGAHTAADVVKPELAIAIEGGITGDVPAGTEETQARLGAGPGIFLYDSWALPNRKLVSLIKQTAEEKASRCSDLVRATATIPPRCRRATAACRP